MKDGVTLSKTLLRASSQGWGRVRNSAKALQRRLVSGRAGAVGPPEAGTLLDSLSRAPRYRTACEPATLGTHQLVVVCQADELEEASRWLEGAQGKVTAWLPAEPVVDKPTPTTAPEGLELLTPEELRQRPALTVVVHGKHQDRKWVFLAGHGIRHGLISNLAGYKKGRHDPDFFTTYRSRLERLHDRLEDDDSRLTLAGIVKQRLTGDHGYLRISSYPEYEHPIVHAEEGDTVFDLGMETAHTSLRFSARVGPGGRVFGFEASPEHWDPIQADLDEAAAANVTMVRKGVWNKAGELAFAGGMKGASRIVPAGDERATLKVPLVDLDTFCQEEQVQPVGMLSFDVEGAEPQALRGVRRTIQRDAPKLQISLYHSMKHLLELPEYVDSLGVDYRFFLGHHSAQGLETDLYAIARR